MIILDLSIIKTFKNLAKINDFQLLQGSPYVIARFAISLSAGTGNNISETEEEYIF